MLLLLALGTATACHQHSSAPPASTSGVSGPLQIDLKVSPEHPSMTKAITLYVHLTGQDGQAVDDAQISGELTMKLMDMGTTHLNFASEGNGGYEAVLKGLDMSGPWSLAVQATKGPLHAKKVFELIVLD